MKKILISLLIAALVCFTFSALADGDTLAFDTGVNQVNEGETLQTVLTREGDAAGGELTYTSSDTKVATVDENGLVTGVKKGKAIISAVVKTEKKTYRAKLNLTVVRPATSVSVKKDKLEIYGPTDEKIAALLTQRENAAENELSVLLLPVKKTVTINATVEPADATSRAVILTSDDPGIFAVSKNTIKGVAKGDTILTVASQLNPEIAEQLRVLVIQQATRLTAEASAPNVAVGEQIRLSTTVIPEDTSIPAVVWSSDSPAIATVTEDGVVTGIKRGTARMVATVQDGSKIRANISVKVVQKAEQIEFKNAEATVDAGKTVQLTATVLPKNTDDKSVVWTSSDESVATVSKTGRVTGVSLGDAEITCTSASVPEVKATAVVHVQQPVTKITFNDPPEIYVGESGKITWNIEPANASNPTIKLSSGNTKILTIDADGTITGVKAGETTINAISTDGSNRRARIKVKVLQHVLGVHMKRNTAYIEVGETATTRALLEPADASNKNMTFECTDEDIATIRSKQTELWITGKSKGDTVVIGTTEDGGYQASVNVKVGNWDKSVKLTDAYVTGDEIHLTVKNVSDLDITYILADVYVFDINGDGVPANKKDNSNKFQVAYSRTLKPGKETVDNGWKTINFMSPDSPIVSEYVVKVVQFQIDNDWYKNIRPKNQPTKKCPVHL